MVAWVRHQMNARRPVLVHCRKGAGRSAMVACATLVALGYPLDVAYHRLRQVRPAVALSSGQAKALESLALLVAGERDWGPAVSPGQAGPDLGRT
jgi:protein-tyrosine phosphatase